MSTRSRSFQSVLCAGALLFLNVSSPAASGAKSDPRAPNRALPQFTQMRVLPSLRDNPSDEEIARLRLFPQTIVPVDASAPTGLFGRSKAVVGSPARPVPLAENAQVVSTLRALASDP